MTLVALVALVALVSLVALVALVALVTLQTERDTSLLPRGSHRSSPEGHIAPCQREEYTSEKLI